MLRVIVPPDPIVGPGDLPGTFDSAQATAVIAAVTAAIDGPAGWLGRALGAQTLELTDRDFYQRDFPTDHIHHHHGAHLGLKLPCPPLISVESVKYLDEDEVEHTIDPAVYRVADNRLWLRKGQNWPALGDFPDAARVRYQAGYNKTPVASGGTGDVPFGAKQAIIVAAVQLMSMPATGFLSIETVEGVGRTDYTVTSDAARVIQGVCDQLLQGLAVLA